MKNRWIERVAVLVMVVAAVGCASSQQTFTYEPADIDPDYWLPKVAGPPHLSFADRGITFATNRQRGLCIELERPYPGIGPLGLLRHAGATVTVDDIEGLTHALRRGT